MTLSVMEGVAFALRDCMEIAKANGIKVDRSKICGGGAQNPVWRSVAANVLGIPVDTLVSEEGPAYGAAILAMTGCGEYKTVKEAAQACVKVKETAYPDSALAKAYEKQYSIFKEFYPALKGAYKKMSEVNRNEKASV